MAIVTEYYRTREDGVVLNRTYSDKGLKIRKVDTDEIYDEAVDDAELNLQYVETDEPSDIDKASAEDYINALTSVGVNFNEEEEIE